MRTLSPTLIFAVALGSSSALAQSGALEEVIVTAQKRAESMQDAPIAISAFNNESIQELGAFNAVDLPLQ